MQQQNLHAGVARNRGIQEASGEYIHFLDSDDWIDSNAYEKWYATAIDKDADVCICYHQKYDNKTGAITRSNQKLKKYITIG